MSMKAEWAYNFSCHQSLEAINRIFNDAGPWQWQMRDNYIFGIYMNTRPAEGLHFRVHEYPQAFFKGFGEEGFSALLQIENSSPVEKEEIDKIFRSLLEKVVAVGITEIEPYD